MHKIAKFAGIASVLIGIVVCVFAVLEEFLPLLGAGISLIASGSLIWCAGRGVELLIEIAESSKKIQGYLATADHRAFENAQRNR